MHADTGYVCMYARTHADTYTHTDTYMHTDAYMHTVAYMHTKKHIIRYMYGV